MAINFSAKGSKISLLIISAVISIISFFLLRGNLYYIAPTVAGMGSAFYFSYARKINATDKLFLYSVFFVPLIIICFGLS